MASAMLSKVLVNGVDVSARCVNWKCKDSFGEEIRDIKLTFNKKIYADIPTLNSGMSIKIYRGETTSTDQFVFDGFIDTVNKQGLFIEVMAKDKMISLVRKNVRYSYNGAALPSTEGRGSWIMTDMIETWGGMTASVVDTGSTILIEKFICNDTDIFSRLQMLADIYDYMIYYDTDDEKVHCEPKGYLDNSIPLVIGQNVSKVPKWIFDNTQCVNQLTVKGAVQSVETNEQFNGDGTSASFILGAKPATVKLFIDGVEKVAGVERSTSGSYDYSIDKETATIKFQSGSIPAAGVNNINVQYTKSIPVPIQVEDTNSQTTYGLHTAVKHFSDIQSVDDAEQRGQNFLDKYANPFVKVNLQVSGLHNYEAGQKVPVTDGYNNESRNLLINSISKKWPGKLDTLEMGDKDWRLAEWGVFTIERVRRLEEEQQKNTELIISVKTFPSDYYYDPRYFKVLNDVAGDGFILGHSTKGILGIGQLGKQGGWVENGLTRLIHPNDMYIEDFIDTDFEGSSSTASWDVTENKLIFT